MLKRTITGLVLFGLILTILWLSSYSHFVFEMVVLLFMGIAIFEMIKAFRKLDYKPSPISLIFFLAGVYPLCYFYGGIGLILATVGAVLVAFCAFIFDSRKKINDFLVNVFIIVYPAVLLSFIFIISNGSGAVYEHGVESGYGYIPILFAMSSALVGDAMAYFGGSLFGKRKIFPKISPKKTVAGCLFELLGGALGGLLVWGLFECAPFPTYVRFLFGNVTPYPYLIYIFVGILMSAVAIIGDLGASRIKREVGLKDYGTIFGSHGGVIDRIDSMLFTLPVMAAIMFIAFPLC